MTAMLAIFCASWLVHAYPSLCLDLHMVLSLCVSMLWLDVVTPKASCVASMVPAWCVGDGVESFRGGRELVGAP